MTNILALDTTMGACSVAIMHGGEVIVSHKENRARGHVERLLPMIDELFEKTNIKLADMDYLAVAVGPGTFAGVRIGLSAAKGMALALDVPIISMNTLEAIAFEFANRQSDYCGTLDVVVDARRGELYTQSFGIKKGTVEPTSDANASSIADVQNRVEAGTGVIVGSGSSYLDNISERFANGYDHPDASYIAMKAAMSTNMSGLADDISPLYLRAPDAVRPAPFSVKVTDD